MSYRCAGRLARVETSSPVLPKGYRYDSIIASSESVNHAPCAFVTVRVTPESEPSVHFKFETAPPSCQSQRSVTSRLYMFQRSPLATPMAAGPVLVLNFGFKWAV